MRFLLLLSWKPQDTKISAVRLSSSKGRQKEGRMKLGVTEDQDGEWVCGGQGAAVTLHTESINVDTRLTM